MKALIEKYKDIILYGIFGVLTTIVNLATYYVCARMLHIPVMVSSLIAWVVGVAFAYVTNRIFVFQSEKTGKEAILKELIAFVLARVFSEVLELIILGVFVTWLGQNDMVWKVISNIVVIIVNYVASKFVVFKK